jgi:hypothetical protein
MVALATVKDIESKIPFRSTSTFPAKFARPHANGLHPREGEHQRHGSFDRNFRLQHAKTMLVIAAQSEFLRDTLELRADEVARVPT